MKPKSNAPESTTRWRYRLHEIIFESDTRIGRGFDVALIVVILMSVAAVMLESVGAIRMEYGDWLFAAEWGFTLLFTAEYILRLSCVRSPLHYARSFYGIVDLVAVIPTYISLVVPGAQYLLVVRLLRILRVFRVLKLVAYLDEAHELARALRASRRKILVFMLTVLILVVILGSMMYFVEGGENGFTSIPKSVYWAVVTLTTVGYGDISPHTPLGQALAALVMILGYGIIAIPTGIVTAQLARPYRTVSGQSCPKCATDVQDPDAKYCRRCGTLL
jgi:voltage-gated potassium channel